MHINVKFNYHNNWEMQFINCMSEGCNRFRQHNTVRERIPQINNTFIKAFKGMTIINS